MEENKKENVFKKLLKKEIIISLVVGLLLGIVIMFFVNGGIEAFVSGKFITEGKLYNEMKGEKATLDVALESIDSAILNKKYKLTKEEKDEIEGQAKKELDYYKQAYGYTEDAVLEMFGFADYDSFIDFYLLDYKRTINLYDYVETMLEKDAVKNYYDEHAFGKVNTKHILVKFSDDLDDAQALSLANEIITKLNNGEEFDKLATDYTTNHADSVITEDLGEMGAFDNLEESYVNAMKELEAGKYTTEPVKTSYGYHVIYCVDKTEKTEEIPLKDKMMIVYTLANEAEITVDDAIYYKALIKMREDSGLKFFDKQFKVKYEEYCEPYVEVEEEHNHSEEQNEIEVNVSLDTQE